MPEEKNEITFDEPLSAQANRPSAGAQRIGGQNRPSAVGSQAGLSQKLVKLREAKKEAKTVDGDDPRDIQAGMTVEHQRFGKGKVQQIEGSFPNLKATVFFQNAGQKQLLLKFAKLKIIR